MAPTYPAPDRNATVSAGTSNLGSWVSTQMNVDAEISCVSRYSCGHMVTTSSASGKRSGVAKTGRASHSVTR